MNKYIKDTLIFVLGAGAGGAATYFFAKNKYEKMCEAEISNMRETYINMQKDLVELNEEEKKRLVNETALQMSGYLTESTTDTVEINDLDDEVTEDEPVAVELPRQNSFDKNVPEFITEEEYSTYEDSIGPFEPRTLFYNDVDGEIYDEDRTTLIDDPANLLGESNVDKLPELFVDNSSIYVRNYTKRNDYEILLDLGD